MKYFTLFCIFLASLPIVAQRNLSGTIVTKADGAPVELATVRLFSYTEHNGIKDSTLVQGTQTGFDGVFVMTQLRPGAYRLHISSVGFNSLQLPVEIPANEDVSLPTIRLTENVHQLAEVNIEGRAAEMVVKGDTIEYNTAAYQVSETATVEELLKKMNGVSVDKEGNVTVNGEEIKSIRIDGKKFFGDDVQTATKNIPAEMIDKIQVIDEKSEMAKLTGFEDDETERIINLSLKKNRKQGLFGNYSGALGADLITADGKWVNYGSPLWGATANEQFVHFLEDDLRYNANLFTNILLGESQTTIIAGANNTNEIRSRRGRGQWGGQNAGITMSENIGVNTNIDLGSKIEKKDHTTSLLMGGDATFNHSYNDTRTQTSKDSYTEDATYHNNDSTNKFSQSWNAQMRLEIEYQIDSMNKLILRPTIGYTQNDYTSTNSYLYEREDEIINDGYQNQMSLNEDISAGLRAIYNHKFARAGRTLTLQGNFNFTNTKGKTDTYAWDNIRMTSLVDQYTHSGNNALSYSLRASYVEPIYKKNHFLELSAYLSGSNRSSRKNQYTLDTLSLTPTDNYVFDSIYSNELDNHLYIEQLELNYRWVSEKIDLTAGARVLASQTYSRTYYGGILARDTLYNNWNWAPNIDFKYKFGRKEFARIFYRGNSQQPTIMQMEPVRNNSDAMNETVGNLSLQPAFRHNAMFMYSRFNQEKFSSIMTGLRASLTEDALTNNTIYDQYGKRYNQTVNADIIPWNINADFMSNTPFCNKKLQLHTRTTFGYNQRVAYVSREQDASTIEQMIATGTMMLGEESKTGNLRASNHLSLRFTHKFIDIGLNNNNAYSYTINSLNQTNRTHTGDWTIGGDITLHLPKAWNISSDIAYTARYGYTGLTDINELIWNASIDKTWNNATLSLKVYDLLQDKKNIVQTVGENYVSYQKYNTLPTYFLLTFTYKLNRMGSLKAKGAAGFMQEMIERGGGPGMPGGGRPPMGPPPHMM